MSARSTRASQPSHAYELFILVLTVLSLVIMVALVLPFSPITNQLLLVYDNLICAVFLFDFFTNLRRASPKRAYLIGRHEVTFAENGEEGLSAVRDRRPDLVMTDLEMPGMDGIAFAREVRADAAAGHLPIIMLTARADVDPAREVRIDAFATKPPSSTEVLELVSRLLG